MKTVELTVYNYSELSERAKAAAATELDVFDCYWPEIRATIQAFADHFAVSLEWEIDATNSTPTAPARAGVAAFFADPEDPENIESLTDAVHRLGTYDPETFTGYGDCVLTGVFWDEIMGDSVRRDVLRDGVHDREAVAVNAMNALESAIHAEYEYLNSDEMLEDFAEMNDLHFTAAGEIWV